jgi:hypothetical protein
MFEGMKIGTSNDTRHKMATLQFDHVLAQLNITDVHASSNVLKWCQSMIEGTLSLSSQCSPNFTHNPNLMSNETLGLSLRFVATPPIPTLIKKTWPLLLTI